MAKKKQEKWVRLANGAVEQEEPVGEIVILLRNLAAHSPKHFEALAGWFVFGRELPSATKELLRDKKYRFMKPDEDVLWDDVRDVLDSFVEIRGKSVSLGASPLHVNQKDVIPPDEE